jgi:hypothetical protein
MSMTVHIALKGITDLALLLEALREMGIKTERTAAAADTRQTGKIVAFACLGVRRLGFAKDKTGNIHMVGERNSPFIKDENFQNKIRQNYSLAAVKRKVVEMNFSVAQVENLEDGSIRLVARQWR